MANFEDLDWAFTCPTTVTDADLRGGYEILVSRFRLEGEHLPLNTAWQLLIERAISAYIRVKQIERRKIGATGGFTNAGQEKEYNVFVQGLLHEVNDVLRKHYPNADRELTLAQVKDVMLSVMRDISDVSVRDDLSRRFASAFERNGF
jgi:hypothetical protein